MKNQIYKFIVMFIFLHSQVSFGLGSDAKKSKDKTGPALKEDKRCDEDFITQLSAKESCFKDGDILGCNYLASAGLGAASGMGVKFLADIAKQRSTSIKGVGASRDSGFSKLQNAYKQYISDEVATKKIEILYRQAEVKANEVLYRELLGKEPKKLSSEMGSEKFPGENDMKYNTRLVNERNVYLEKIKAEYGKKISYAEAPQRWGGGSGYGWEHSTVLFDEARSQLLKLLDEPGRENLKKVYIKSGKHYGDPTPNVADVLRGERAKQLAKDFPQEMEEYRKQAIALKAELEKLSRRIDPDFVEKVMKLDSKTYRIMEELEVLDEVEANDKNSDRVRKLREELRDNNKETDRIVRDHKRLTDPKILEHTKQFEKDFLKTNPKSFLIGKLAGGTAANHSSEFLRYLTKMRTETGKTSISKAGYLRSGLIGATAFLVPEIIVSDAARKRLNTCSGSLGLTSEEVTLLEGHISNLSALGKCEKLKFDDDNAILTSAMAQFGYIPKGICEMALRSNAKYDNLVKNQNIESPDCNTINGKDFKMKTEMSGKKPFECVANKITYRFPIDLDNNIPNIEKVEAYYNGRRTPTYESKLRVSYRVPKALTAASEAPVPNSWSMQTERCLDDSKDKTPICVCLKGAMVNRAAMLVNSASKSCSSDNATTKDPKESGRSKTSDAVQ